MLRNYLILSWKVLRRRPFFTFVSLFGIALTLSALVVASAVLDHLLSSQAPEPKLDRSLFVHELRLTGERYSYTGNFGHKVLAEHLRDLENAESVSLFQTNQRVSTYVDGLPIDFSLKRTDGPFFDIHQLDFLEGGPFGDDDERQARRVLVLDATTRKQIFGERPAVGGGVAIDGQRYEVVGVVADVSRLRQVPYANAWAPISTRPGADWRRELSGDYQAVIVAPDRARLPALRAEVERALAEVDLAGSRFDRVIARPYSRLESWGVDMLGPSENPGRSRGLEVGVLLGGLALLFMLLPALNLVNLAISRILERSSEIGVRKAFGAASSTLVAQLLVENLVLTALGSACAFVLAGGLLDLLSQSAMLPVEVGLNFRVFGWAVLFTVVFGLVSGAIPAWKMSRLHPNEALRGISR